MIGKRIDPFANHRDPRMSRDRLGHMLSERTPVDRERGPRRNPGPVGRAHHQAAHPAHFLVKQPDCIILGVVRPKAVRTDHLGQLVGLVRRGRAAAAAHFAKAHGQAGLGQLPGRFASGEPAADDLNVEVHSRALRHPARLRNPFLLSALRSPKPSS